MENPVLERRSVWIVGQNGRRKTETVWCRVRVEGIRNAEPTSSKRKNGMGRAYAYQAVELIGGCGMEMS